MKIRRSKLKSIINEEIKKVDDSEWAVYPEHGGERLGTHASEDAAQDQLAAIHMNEEEINEQSEMLDPAALGVLGQTVAQLVSDFGPVAALGMLAKITADAIKKAGAEDVLETETDIEKFAKDVVDNF